jgi:hypothetical protein
MKPSEPLAVAVQRVRHFMHPRGPETSSTNPGAGATAAGGQQHAAAAGNDDIVITDDEEDVVVGNRCVVPYGHPTTPAVLRHTSNDKILEPVKLLTPCTCTPHS